MTYPDFVLMFALTLLGGLGDGTVHIHRHQKRTSETNVQWTTQELEVLHRARIGASGDVHRKQDT